MMVAEQVFLTTVDELIALLEPFAAIGADEVSLLVDDGFLLGTSLGGSGGGSAAVFCQARYSSSGPLVPFAVDPTDATASLKAMKKSIGGDATIQVAVNDNSIGLLHRTVRVAVPHLNETVVKTPSAPKLKYEGDPIVIDRSNIDSALKTAKGVWGKKSSLFCEIVCEDGVAFLRNYDDKASGKSVEITLGATDQSCRSIFSGDLLLQAIGAIPKGTIHLYVGGTYPVTISSVGANPEVRVMIAPRVET